MNGKQAERIRTGKGFLAALDQSGGSTPKALEHYGISRDAYANDEEMFDLVHLMRTRIVTSPAFTGEYILGAILFEQTMDRKVEGLFTGDYLWQKKGIVPFLKVDKGLAALEGGVQMMKPIDGLDALLKRAAERNIFGTKMRSVIQQAVPEGIANIVDQQFMLGKQISDAGLVPIIEPEVDIHSADKMQSELLLKQQLLKHLDALDEGTSVMLKLSIPSEDGFYADLIRHPRVLRVVALSGGYSQAEADERLARNPGLIASFSRALAEGLSAGQTDEQFNETLVASIRNIYAASIT
ncbi:MAG: fructose bisphosphate aldolase [Clostridiales bacterium]|nr:fructose bisphosphate aldolase [Clostridiales bacterium]